MDFIKRAAKRIIKDNRILYRFFHYYRFYRSYGAFKTISYCGKDVFLKYHADRKLNHAGNVAAMLSRISFREAKQDLFFYNIDTHKVFYSKYRYLENFSIDYSFILLHSLEDMMASTNAEYYNDKNNVVLGIKEYIDNTIQFISKTDYKNKEDLITWFSGIKERKALHFDEALQRILFFNQLLWQTGHVLIGLGRLDKILYAFYSNDINNGYLKEEDVHLLVNRFLRILHEYYWFKSNSLLGDTGQIIVLGGQKENGEYEVNELTHVIIEEVKKIHNPDPKLLLRVAENMPRELLSEALNCIKTGIGSPLLANDDVIIPLLTQFGYKQEDAFNYAVSACWEPLIPGKAAEQNNVLSLVFVTPFIEMFEKENLDTIGGINGLLSTYKEYIDKYVSRVVSQINEVKYEKEPLVSLFIEECDRRGEDITLFWGEYNNWGLTTVSLGNVVNSILNIKKMVFEEKRYSLSEINAIRQKNYKNNNKLLEELKQSFPRYGMDEEGVIVLCNEIMGYMSDAVSRHRIHGGKIRIGYSAPSYISCSLDQKATFDGRRNDDPFEVHISSDVSGLPYTALFNFAGGLDYSGNKINGNVVDYIINPSFLENYLQKFLDFMMLCISERTFFEMQMNVVSSKVLIDAKRNPSLYPNLIVRVWGFSAFFNDLPEAYKDVLIRRTIECEQSNG